MLGSSVGVPYSAHAMATSPSITRAAESAGSPAPRVVAGLPVCVTEDEAGVRGRIAEQFGLAGQVPEYRAMLDREGVAGPQDVAVVGDARAVARWLARLADAGVTDFLAAPFGTVAEQDRTVRALAGLTMAVGAYAAVAVGESTMTTVSAPGLPL